MPVKKSANYDAFFYPKTIAIIGASDNSSKVGGILAEKLLTYSKNPVLINPNKESIRNIKCYKSVLDYPGEIDLAVIAIPSNFVPDAIAQCGKKRIKSAIIISAGFSESGNIVLEHKLLSIARKYGISLLGPNCFGICNPSINLDLTFSATTAPKGDIAMISQSGALWSYISDFAAGHKEKHGFSSFVSLGNMADLEFDDLLYYFLNDKKTKSIVLYIEKLKDGRSFLNLCKRYSNKKKIYAIKAGSSKKGSIAAISHTASIASDYEIYKGFFKQAGVEQCSSLIEAFEKATGKKLLAYSKNKLKIGKNVFIITNAGGAGVLMSDYLSEKGFNIVDEPQDLLGTALAEDYSAALDSLKIKNNFDSVLVILTPQSMSEIDKTANVISEKYASFSAKSKNFIPLFLGGQAIKSANKIFNSKKIMFFNTLEEARETLVF